MKRSKRLLLLLAALAVVSLGTLGLLHTEEKKEQIKVSGEIILELDSDSVQALSWKNETEALALSVSVSPLSSSRRRTWASTVWTIWSAPSASAPGSSPGR